MSAATTEDDVREIDVPDGAGGRADRVVADLTGLSRSRIQRLISDGRLVTPADAPIRARDLLTAGAHVQLTIPPLEVAEAQPNPTIAFEVVYEDDDLLIIDKPAGLVVHPAAGHDDDTLVNALLARAGASEYGGIGGVRRPGIVHRLDKDTSGLLIVAKHDAAQAGLMAQLKARRVKKTYLALVAGSVAAEVGRIEAPIGRDHRNRRRMAVVPDGRPSVTGYRVRERLAGWSLLEVDLVTGRTHQIRVHVAAIGHPIAGDPIYGTGSARRGPDGLDRMFLHAWRLELTSPSGDRLIRAEAALPAELAAVLDGLRARSAGAPGQDRPERGGKA